MTKIFPLLFLVVLAVSCTTSNVAVDYDRDFDFSKVKSYQITSDSRADVNPLDSGRIMKSLALSLVSKNISENNDGDILLRITPKEYTINKNSSFGSIGVGGGNGGVGGGISVGIPIQSKKLVKEYKIEMLDPNPTQNSLIWQGELSIEMPQNASPETRENAIRVGVQKLLANFPPQKSSK